MSIVEKNILSREFIYDPPWFYNNELALRCELGIGEDDDEYMLNAKTRAWAIYNILFEKEPSAFFFLHWIYDHDDDGRYTRLDIARTIKGEKERLKFTLEHLRKFKHRVIKEIPFDKDDYENLIRRNRIVCFPNDKLDAKAIIEGYIDYQKDAEISFVSYENECIFSVYDDRGCDIVFYDKEKFKEFYPKLKPYFLPYDLKLMEERLKKCK